MPLLKMGGSCMRSPANGAVICVITDVPARPPGVEEAESDMCGIVGYIGFREAQSVLIDSLKRLEYRGYDSCGLVIMDEAAPKLIRSVGRIGLLEQKIKRTNPVNGLVKCG